MASRVASDTAAITLNSAPIYGIREPPSDIFLLSLPVPPDHIERLCVICRQLFSMRRFDYLYSYAAKRQSIQLVTRFAFPITEATVGRVGFNS